MMCSRGEGRGEGRGRGGGGGRGPGHDAQPRARPPPGLPRGGGLPPPRWAGWLLPGPLASHVKHRRREKNFGPPAPWWEGGWPSRLAGPGSFTPPPTGGRPGGVSRAPCPGEVGVPARPWPIPSVAPTSSSTTTYPARTCDTHVYPHIPPHTPTGGCGALPGQARLWLCQPALLAPSSLHTYTGPPPPQPPAPTPVSSHAYR